MIWIQTNLVRLFCVCVSGHKFTHVFNRITKATNKKERRLQLYCYIICESDLDHFHTPFGMNWHSSAWVHLKVMKEYILNTLVLVLPIINNILFIRCLTGVNEVCTRTIYPVNLCVIFCIHYCSLSQSKAQTKLISIQKLNCIEPTHDIPSELMLQTWLSRTKIKTKLRHKTFIISDVYTFLLFFAFTFFPIHNKKLNIIQKGIQISTIYIYIQMTIISSVLLLANVVVFIICYPRTT